MTRPEGCNCDWHSYMVGDGCYVCNPALWEHLCAPEDDEETDSAEDQQ